ncbi:D-alanyl-D-alanine carboxypeptidase family protein [Streptacidiphilus sp. N1-3]|uniref:serine-type D-Ala-D-Ala carboxypeptidase n=1 Tax=Streptacidiphilus alkalitolerans TaxID=3342712 RepID=A0ABV6X523_9ACTN
MAGAPGQTQDRSENRPAPAPGPGSGPTPPPAPAAPAEPAPAAAEEPQGALDSPTTALRVSLDDPTRTLRQATPAAAAAATAASAVATGASPAASAADADTVRAPQAPQPTPPPAEWRSAPAAEPWTTAPEAERTRPMAAWTPPPAPPPGPPGPGGPDGPPSGDEFPETTSEAMEVLATLNRRPASALRRTAKRIGLWGGLLCFLLVVLAVVQVLRPLPTPDLKLTAASNFAFTGSAPTLAWPPSGQATAEVSGLGSLGHTGSDNPVPIASVTKVMTAHLILKDHPLKSGELGPLITVDKQAQTEYQQSVSSGESSAKVTEGEQISEYQALQMLLIPSANNIARLLGRWDAGSDAAFVTRMQSEAGALGMTKSTYTDPSGLEGSTRSTANDQLKLAETVMLDPVFREIVGTASFTPPGDKLTYNNNDLLDKNGVIGIKTGSSTAALGCLMWAAEQKIGGTTQTVLGVVLSQPAVNGVGYLPMVLANSKKVILSAEAALQSHTIAKKGDVVGYADDGLGGKVPVVASKDVTVVGWGSLSVDVSLDPPIGGLPHTAKAGTTVGTLEVGTGPSAQQIPVTLQADLTAPSYQARLTRLG